MQVRRPEQHFEATSTRLAHIQRVVANAEIVESRETFGGRLILAAAYHDIGYAPDLAVTRFHPVDSALIATADGLPPTVVEAVLHHTGAHGEASRARPDLLIHYPTGCEMMSSYLSRALTFCDLHAGPDGEACTVAQRLADIRHRHAENTALLDNIAAHEGRFLEIDCEFGHLLW
jgi:hypothetical protein